ncbi:MAG: permease [Patescibacteria group bacterium]|nr:permease [Patescibacteria group bacterium]
MFYPIKIFADWLSCAVFGLSPETIFGEAVNFFIYDTIKIFILLAVIIFAVSFLRTFLPKRKIKKILSRHNKYFGHFLAAVFGIITPFCSCSAVPLFLGFTEAGVPLGITFTFLVASPMINEVALVLLLGMFGLKIALFYVFSGLTIAIFSGIVIGKLKTENLIKNFSFDEKTENLRNDSKKIQLRRRILYAKNYTTKIIKKVWPYIFIGIGFGALIHGYVPADFLAKYTSANEWYAVPIATLIGIPLYSNAAGVIPIVNALFEKGVPLGTALAFMMAVTALSLPEFLILKKVMKTKLIIIFATVVGLGIIFTGYFFNLVF